MRIFVTEQNLAEKQNVSTDPEVRKKKANIVLLKNKTTSQWSQMPYKVMQMKVRSTALT